MFVHVKRWQLAILLLYIAFTITSAVTLNRFLGHGKWGQLSSSSQTNEKTTSGEPKEQVIYDLAPWARVSRDSSFWSRAAHIYLSYKTFQLNPFGNQTDAAWEAIHEENSQRMIDLCLHLRGFYLKTGQFLGTRHDFMPRQYTTKLAMLHDSVPPLGAQAIRKVIEEELGPIDKFFKRLNLESPIGSASVAQVHEGIWKKTNEKVAVKVQYPNAETLMTSDLRNLRALAEFLQRTELKFDVLSAIKELQSRIKNEFDFKREAKNMDNIRTFLAERVPDVTLPRSIFSSKKVIVMTFVEGDNLSKLASFKEKSSIAVPTLVKRRAGRKLMNILSRAWGEMIFELKQFNADPHPGNICISRSHGIGLLDWGQIKVLSDVLLLKFARLVEAMDSRDKDKILDSFFDLGVKVTNPQDKQTVADIAVTMLDTRHVPGYVIDPFNPQNALKTNAVSEMPADLYFIVRTVQLFRGICFAFDLDFSLASAWAPYAKKVIMTASVDKKTK